MGTTLAPLDLELYQRTDEVLHYLWDPIGISTAPEARDEYQGYLPRVYGLLKSGANTHKIASYLTEIATQRMGLEPNHRHDLKIAELLLRWREVVHEKAV